MDEAKTNISNVVIHMLKGILYRDRHPKIWHDLVNMKAVVMDYLSVIGLECLIDEFEGFAYLKQKDISSEEDPQQSPLPRLIQKRSLSYPVSLLCVLLRKKLIEADAGGEESRIILTHEQITDMMRLFIEDTPNEVKIYEQVETHINKIIELGFLRQLNKQEKIYELRRIIKAFVDADWSSSVDEKLEEYKEYAIGE